MGSASRRPTAALVDGLARRPTAWDFFQAVRVLEAHLCAERDDAEGAAERRSAVGHDADPDDEVIRFGVAASLGFPVGPVQEAVVRSDAARARVLVTFLGTVGTAGVLPQNYTELVIQRAHLRDESLRDFLDVFHHRTISLFYRAWLKYRLPFAWERARAVVGEHGPRRGEDAFTAALASLVGLGTRHLGGRSALPDRARRFFGGHFARPLRTAVGLEGVLEDYLGVPVRVEQFSGRWLTLVERDRSRIARDPSLARHNRLGEGMVLGSRVYDVQSKLDIRVGPVGSRHLRELEPGSPGAERLDALVRSYLDDGLDYAVHLDLDAAEIRPMRMGSAGSGEARAGRLGRDTWLMSPGVPVRSPRVSILDSSTQKDTPLRATGRAAG